MVVESVGSQARQACLETPSAIASWVTLGKLPRGALCLSFPVCKTEETTVPPPQGCCDDSKRSSKQMLSSHEVLGTLSYCRYKGPSVGIWETLHSDTHLQT